MNNLNKNGNKRGMHMIGRKHTNEVKEKMSLAKKGKKPKYIPRPRLGKDNHFWKGGIAKQRDIIFRSKEYRLWRIAIFTRDNYTCVWCGQIGGKLNADHIKAFSQYPELRFAIDNGRTLCINCHRKTDNYGGKANKK